VYEWQYGFVASWIVGILKIAMLKIEGVHRTCMFRGWPLSYGEVRDSSHSYLQLQGQAASADKVLMFIHFPIRITSYYPTHLQTPCKATKTIANTLAETSSITHYIILLLFMFFHILVDINPRTGIIFK
jgi:hypothetical protein